MNPFESCKLPIESQNLCGVGAKSQKLTNGLVEF